MKKTIFYSWQSDLPNTTNRAFIQQALEQAAGALAGDDSINVDPVIERDTFGVAGSPDIAVTILAKIAAADVFVPDVSLITPPGAARRSPNPNVLLELGFAISALGWDRIVMVMNTTFGPPTDLPFDLRGRRATTYALPEGTSDKAGERKRLEGALRTALRTVFERQTAAEAALVIAPPPLEEQAVGAISAVAPDRAAAVRRFARHTDDGLLSLAPDLSGGSPDFSLLKNALDPALPLVAAWGRVAARAAEMRDGDSLNALFRTFETILPRYDMQRSGSSYPHEFDFWRFIGHELAVMIVACMIREDLWETLGEVLNRDIILDPPVHRRRGLPFSRLRAPVVLCAIEGSKRRRLSLHADILKERHSAEPLASILGFRAFMEADYFLFLKSALPSDTGDTLPRWIPESAIFLDHPPRYLVEAQHVASARRLADAIGVAGPEVLRDRLLQRHVAFGRYFEGTGFPPDPFEDHMDVIHRLGSR